MTKLYVNDDSTTLTFPYRTTNEDFLVDATARSTMEILDGLVLCKIKKNGQRISSKFSYRKRRPTERK